MRNLGTEFSAFLCRFNLETQDPETVTNGYSQKHVETT